MAQTLTRPTSRLDETSASQIASFAAPVGRLLLSTIFLLSGAMKFANWQMFTDMMASKGMPFVPFFLTAAALVELIAGLSVLLGCQARLGAFALFLYLIPTTLIFHDFWAYQGAAQQDQMQHFLKNLAIMGGLLAIVAFGAGPLSIDHTVNRTSQRSLWWRDEAGTRPA